MLDRIHHLEEWMSRMSGYMFNYFLPNQIDQSV